ncbi:hypothetical protein Rhe02_31520 [Rhizocola hellebori]|uniref:Secreted protein n=1 Tax=Rhizocola hellebori TaxID=1392758 RepID=A0A8J3Q765_9ACTN|nr:hypothetical protein [Rhizocola hellebori]GIH05085.1 hypothetical protein Rhe02_31520 [Rhizocola hellebori]
MLKYTRAAIVTAIAAATVTFGVQLAHSAPAHAASIPTVPCAAQGVTDADKNIAKDVTPKLNGDHLGKVDGYQVSCARAVVDQVKARGMDEKAAKIAVATTIVETNLHNYNKAVDYDSLGLFQQRPSSGWGKPTELVNPAYATDAFLDRMVELHPHDSWKTKNAGDVAQKVQVSAFPDRYATQMDDATTLVSALWK